MIKRFRAGHKMQRCIEPISKLPTAVEEEYFIDATFVMVKGGGLEIGATKRGKGSPP